MKRDWRKDHAARKAARNLAPKDSVYDLAHDAGKPLYSKAHKQMMVPETAKRIDPGSDEGKAIAARYNTN